MDFLKDLSLDKVRNLAEDAFNQAKPKSDLEAKVYEVLSHKNWGASSTIMNEIARDTYDHEKFMVVSQLMWENMENQRPAAWRVVFKGLSLLEHLVKNGSERCVDDARNHGHSLRSLQQFNYYEGTIDRGLGVREKSKQLIEILSDDERIREERQKSKKLREKFGGNQSMSSSAGMYSGYGNDNWSNENGSGYGGSGIGSNTNENNDDNKGYAGRYDEDNFRGHAKMADPTPTFASFPHDNKKGKSKKKKTTAASELAMAPTDVDLFSFDVQAVGADPPFSAAELDSLQSSNDRISDPFAIPTSTSHLSDVFDPFGDNGQSDRQIVSVFDNFGTSTPMDDEQLKYGIGVGDPFSASNLSTMNNAAKQQQTLQNLADDDDFGDFATAKDLGSLSSITGNTVDPLSRLISLDGLSKNADKNSKDAKLSEPILANPAAATFMQEKDHIQVVVKKSSGSTLSFDGIDGISKKSAPYRNGMLPLPTPASGSSNSAIMGVGGSISVITALNPSVMLPPSHSHFPNVSNPSLVGLQHFGGTVASNNMNNNYVQDVFPGNTSSTTRILGSHGPMQTTNMSLPNPMTVTDNNSGMAMNANMSNVMNMMGNPATIYGMKPYTVTNSSNGGAVSQAAMGGYNTGAQTGTSLGTFTSHTGTRGHSSQSSPGEYLDNNF